MNIKNILLASAIALLSITPYFVIDSLDINKQDNVNKVKKSERTAGFDHEFDESFMPLDMWRSPEQFKEMTSKFNTWALANPDITLYEDHYKNITEDGFVGLDPNWNLEDVDYWLSDFYVWNWNYNLPDKTSKIDNSYFSVSLLKIYGEEAWKIAVRLKKDESIGGGIDIFFNNQDNTYDESWYESPNINGHEAGEYTISFPPLENHLVLPKEKNSIDAPSENEIINLIDENFTYENTADDLAKYFTPESLEYILNKNWFDEHYPDFEFDWYKNSWRFLGDFSVDHNDWLFEDDSDWGNFDHSGSDPHFDFINHRDNHIYIDEPIIKDDIKTIEITNGNQNLDKIHNFEIKIETNENKFTIVQNIEYNIDLTKIIESKPEYKPNFIAVWIIYGIIIFLIIIIIICVIAYKAKYHLNKNDDSAAKDKIKETKDKNESTDENAI